MSLVMAVSFNGRQYSDQLNLHEVEAIRHEVQQDPKSLNAYSLIFNDTEHDEMTSRHVDSEVFHSALSTILDRVLPKIQSTNFYVYASPLAGVPKGASSNLAGARIGDVLLEILGGINKWELRSFKQDDRGGWQEVGVEIRSKPSKIKTDNMGVVEVRGKKCRPETARWLRELRRALDKVPLDGKEVIIQYM